MQFVDLDARSDDDYPSVNEDNFEGEYRPNPHWDAMEDFEYDLEILREREQQEAEDDARLAEEVHDLDEEEKKGWDVDEQPDEKRRYRWCLTIWNLEKWPSMPELKKYIDEKAPGILKYLVGQEEIAPKTGNHHLQVYLEWHNAKGFGGMKRLFPGTWLGIPRGTAAQNTAYCTHPDTAVIGTSLIWGEPGEEAQGKRSDLKDLCDAVIACKNKGALRDIILAQPVAYVRNHNGIHKLAGFNWNQARPIPYVCTVNGPPGSGKSHSIAAMEPFLFRKRAGIWWDGYTGQPACLIDEFHRAKLDLGEYLNITDEQPHQVEVKHGHADLQYERLYLASHRTFDAIIDDLWASDFAFDPDQRVAVKRRIDCMATISTRAGPLGKTIRCATIVRCSHKPVPAGYQQRWQEQSKLDEVVFENNGVFMW